MILRVVQLSLLCNFPTFWHCLCLIILFLCLHLVRSSPCSAALGRKKKGSANTLVLPHGSRAISEVLCYLCASPELPATGLCPPS